jgi:hypothetical protein
MYLWAMMKTIRTGTLEDGETRWQGKATRGEEYVDRDVGTPGVVGYR